LRRFQDYLSALKAGANPIKLFGNKFTNSFSKLDHCRPVIISVCCSETIQISKAVVKLTPNRNSCIGYYFYGGNNYCNILHLSVSLKQKLTEMIFEKQKTSFSFN
jgi:hypothetical protein